VTLVPLDRRAMLARSVRQARRAIPGQSARRATQVRRDRQVLLVLPGLWVPQALKVQWDRLVPRVRTERLGQWDRPAHRQAALFRHKPHRGRADPGLQRAVHSFAMQTYKGRRALKLNILGHI